MTTNTLRACLSTAGDRICVRLRGGPVALDRVLPRRERQGRAGGGRPGGFRQGLAAMPSDLAASGRHGGISARARQAGHAEQSVPVSVCPMDAPEHQPVHADRLDAGRAQGRPSNSGRTGQRSAQHELDHKRSQSNDRRLRRQIVHRRSGCRQERQARRRVVWRRHERQQAALHLVSDEGRHRAAGGIVDRRRPARREPPGQVLRRRNWRTRRSATRPCATCWT